MLTVRRATIGDAISMASRLREADLREIEALGNTPQETLIEGVSYSDFCFVAVDEDDVPHVIFGTAPTEDLNIGSVWMMATDAIREHWVQILKETRPWVDRIRGHYKALANAVHKENAIHIRWLKWAGFTFLREMEFNGNTFLEFAKLTPMEKINV